MSENHSMNTYVAVMQEFSELSLDIQEEEAMWIDEPSSLADSILANVILDTDSEDDFEIVSDSKSCCVLL